jgi:hypothetical protein
MYGTVQPGRESGGLQRDRDKEEEISMLSPLRNRFGIPGVISVIALVFAMLGGAYAANNGSSGDSKATASAKKGPRGPRGPKGPAGPAGPQGPAGPAGAKGDTGAAGANGTNGKDGVSVTSSAASVAECPAGGTKFTAANGTSKACNGKDGEPGDPWTAGGTLPADATETGMFAIFSSAEDKVITSISFPVPLSAPLDEEHVLGLEPGYDGEDEVGAEHEKCPGKVENPRAKSGYLCVYTAAAFSLLFKKPFILSATNSASQGASTSGALLEFLPEAAKAFAKGSFAVTG